MPEELTDDELKELTEAFASMEGERAAKMYRALLELASLRESTRKIAAALAR